MAYYAFIFPGPVELEERRRQLNLAGFHSWLTPIILLIAIYAYRRWLRLSTRPPNTSSSPSRLVLFSRRMSWILSTTYMPEYGPLSVQLLGLIYTIWLLYLVFRATSNDYMHLTKSFGHVAIAQLPIHYLLALKHPLSPITLATGLTHERLNAIHRLLGRIVHALLATHAALYLNFFIQLHILAKRIRDRDVILGVAAFWSFNILALLALPAVRRRMYHRVFYRSHIALSALVLPLLFLHVPYTRVYVVQAAAFWILGGLTRRVARQTVRVSSCEAIPGTKLVDLRFVVKKQSPLACAAPGQHVYVSRRGGEEGTAVSTVTGGPPRTPFTIAGVRAVGQDSHCEIQLVLRNMGGPQTSWLAGIASTSAGGGTKGKINAAPSTSTSLTELQVEGPYGDSGVHYYSDSDSDSNPALLVAGGVGATYILPIYVSLLRQRVRKMKMKMIWIVKTLADARWGVEYLAVHIPQDHRDEVDVEIYITSSSSSSPSPSSSGGAARYREDATNTLPSITGVKIHDLPGSDGRGRPNLRSEIDSFFPAIEPFPSSSHTRQTTQDEHPTTRVFVCGPRGLADDVRRHVGRWVLREDREGREVSFVEEAFGFGGSS